MRRGKPPQVIYTPGSGKLLRSSNNSSVQDNFSDTASIPETINLAQNHSEGENNSKDSQRKSKKPERELYVPRPRAVESRNSPSNNSHHNNSYNECDVTVNGNENNLTMDRTNKSKRYSNNRNQQGEGNGAKSNNQNEWRDKSPGSRNYRNGSEPRSGFNPNFSSSSNNWNRDNNARFNRERDTRSVEPNSMVNRNVNAEASGKMQLSKPPSGRRHSTIGNFHQNIMKNLENLAPRFQKKYLEENGLTLEDINWKAPNYQSNSGYHTTTEYSHYNPSNTIVYNSSYNNGYHTLPARPRGRGRFLNQDHDYPPGKQHFNRPNTPDRAQNMVKSPSNTRSNTPTRRFENRSSSRPPSRSETPLDDNNHYGEKNDLRAKPNVFDRLGGHVNKEPKYLNNFAKEGIIIRPQDRDRKNVRLEKDNRDRTDRRRNNEQRRKRNGREKRSSSRDLNRYESRESNLSSESNRTLIGHSEDNRQVEIAAQREVNLLTDEAQSCSKEDRTVLDWNEEVELEALSDAMTRSSSMTSLHEINSRSLPVSAANTPNSKKKRSGSSCRDRTPTNREKHDDAFGNQENRDFKVPHEGGNGRQRRRSSRDTSYDRFHDKSREVSFDRGQSMTGNWRDEIIRGQQNSEREGFSRASSERSRVNSERDEHSLEVLPKKGGILVLPSAKSLELNERPKYPDIRPSASAVPQKTLFDPKNPNKPILVKSPGGRVSVPGFSDNNSEAPKLHSTDSSGKLTVWYNENCEAFKSCNYPDLLRDIKRADGEIHSIMNNGLLLVNYETVDNFRQFLKNALKFLLCKSMRFCQTTNVEQHLWNILYYNIIEMTRKAIIDDPDNKQQYKEFLLYIIDEGSKFFEQLIGVLEDNYQLKVLDYVGNNSMISHKEPKYTGLVLVSAQKIFMFLGDLGRYREQVNETSNYGKCRQWYIKSHEINPKNGKPYNHLAVLAVFSRRKLDAVYYYMRSLMSSNPVRSAKQNLIDLFDENRKKYEQGEKKRREERLERQRQHMKQKESEENTGSNFLRKETWIRPDGKRLHRTTKALEDQDSEEEDLASLSSVDVNKRFVTSYLHVHGKLITKIGMESFQDAAIQMLKEFRALLQHSPVSLPCNRFLQLLALNMFAIESTQLKDLNLQEQSSGYRSELQERALIISLQMFNLILERCVSILQDHCNSFVTQNKNGSLLDSLPHDANVLLPAIKIWCDWMLCHTSTWNPPPSTHDFKVGPSGDLWSRLGLLMNILERMDQDSADVFINEPKNGYEIIRLPEDATLCGFTPLIFHDREPSHGPSNLDAETAQLRLRISKLLFFGTVFLCGLEPPVLKLEIEDGRRDYVSVVCTDRGQDSPRAQAAVLVRNDEVLLETISGDEEDELISLDEIEEDLKNSQTSSSEEASSEVKELLQRKLELEKKNRSQELHRQRVMKILSQSVVSVHLEIRPKYLVPDTNCFIDHLDSISRVAKNHAYTLMVPIVVLSELEGLSKGTPSAATTNVGGGKFNTSNAEHIKKVAIASRNALEFLKKRHSSVKCVTSKGGVLPSTTFSSEDDQTWDISIKNDDKILATCLVLCRNHSQQQQHQNELKEGEPRYLLREVVLLTEDRNLRVKAHSRDVPVRALPDFMRWAELGG